MDTKILLPGDLPDPERKPEATSGQVKPVVTTPNGVLVIFADTSKALQFELEEQAIMGRRSDSGEQPDIDLAPFGGFPAGVSRLHARLHRTADGLFLEDLSSRNGTFLDGERLKPSEIVAVKNGQHIKLGALQGWLYFGGS